jgi:hypothetical protein
MLHVRRGALSAIEGLAGHGKSRFHFTAGIRIRVFEGAKVIQGRDPALSSTVQILPQGVGTPVNTLIKFARPRQPL